MFWGERFLDSPVDVAHGTAEQVIAYWQVKRDGTRRGIVEVTP